MSSVLTSIAYRGLGGLVGRARAFPHDSLQLQRQGPLIQPCTVRWGRDMQKAAATSGNQFVALVPLRVNSRAYTPTTRTSRSPKPPSQR